MATNPIPQNDLPAKLRAMAEAIRLYEGGPSGEEGTVIEAALEIERLRESEARAWRERNHAVTKMRAWEDVVYVEGLPLRAVRVDEWGPGEGDTVTVPEITPRKLTDLLDEIARLRVPSPSSPATPEG